MNEASTGRFEDDLAFLREHTEVIVLGDERGQALVAVAPEYQGRVMTSTASGGGGFSHGWINRQVIATRRRQPHMTVFGGEDRFWLGPEGGQYSLFFRKGDPFDFEHWQVPEPFDWGGWEITGREQTRASFRKEATLINYSGTRFEVRIDRTVKLLSSGELREHLGRQPDRGLKVIGYESINGITNLGERPWEQNSGLLSIWILGMFKPSASTTVIIPFREGPEEKLGPVVNDRYFGKVPGDRLVLGEGVLFFRSDGRRRGKIGIPAPRARDTAASYDPDNGVLTMVRFTLPEGARDYVDSRWEIQPAPYRGDVVNSYNDGPAETGRTPLGSFYELETSSPAAALRPNETLTHLHRTLHLQGSPALLDPLARDLLGCGLSRIADAFRTATAH